MPGLDDRFVYFPAPWEEREWHEVTGLPLEDVRLRAEDGTRLFNWYLEPPDPEAVLLWCHGNAGNIIHRLDPMGRFYSHRLACLIVGYRGYGLSQGTPSEEGLYQDAAAAYDHLVTERGIEPRRIVGYGQSLGAAVVGELALRRPLAGLILESSFPSVPEVAKRYYAGLPVHLMVQARYDLAARIGRVKAPVLVLHGDKDSMIPIEMGKAVFEAAHEPKEFYRVPGADHNDVYLAGGEDYFQRILHFIRRIT